MPHRAHSQPCSQRIDKRSDSCTQIQCTECALRPLCVALCACILASLAFFVFLFLLRSVGQTGQRKGKQKRKATTQMAAQLPQAGNNRRGKEAAHGVAHALRRMLLSLSLLIAPLGSTPCDVSPTESALTRLQRRSLRYAVAQRTAHAVDCLQLAAAWPVAACWLLRERACISESARACARLSRIGCSPCAIHREATSPPPKTHVQTLTHHFRAVLPERTRWSSRHSIAFCLQQRAEMGLFPFEQRVFVANLA